MSPTHLDHPFWQQLWCLWLLSLRRARLAYARRIFGSFFVTNIFIGVLVNFFGESSGSALMTNQQKEWLQTRLLCMTVGSRDVPVPENPLRLAAYKVVVSKFFDIIISVCIAINVSLLMIEHVGMEKSWAENFQQANLVFLIIFTIEMFLRLLALGPVDYFRDNWLKVDAAIVITSWFTIMFETYSGFQAIRALRVLRILMLLKNAETLRSLFATMVLSLPPAANLTALLFLVLFVFAVIGMQLYGNMARGPYINDNDNFDNVVNAMCLLFQISTGQDFMNLTYEMEIAGQPLVFAYFCSFIITSIWVFFNLFVAVLLENFENNFTAAEMELRSSHTHARRNSPHSILGSPSASLLPHRLKDHLSAAACGTLHTLRRCGARRPRGRRMSACCWPTSSRWSRGCTTRSPGWSRRTAIGSTASCSSSRSTSQRYTPSTDASNCSPA